MNYLALLKAAVLTTLIVGVIGGLLWLAITFPSGALVVGRALTIGFVVGGIFMVAAALYEEFK